MRQPDFANLLRVLRRETPTRPTLFEFFLNVRLYLRTSGLTEWPPADDVDAQLLALSKAFAGAGYDYVTWRGSNFGFPAGEKHRARTISLNEGFCITDRKSFDAYRWPDPDDFDYSSADRLADQLPKGQMIVINGPGGVLENVISLCGYDNLCFMMVDDPELATDVFDAVGSRLVRHYEITAPKAAVGACISNDDWGFKTQTMLSTTDMRAYVFPWHEKIVATIHAAGKPAILHSCGNLIPVMDDVIDRMKYDAKHSFEDVIQPIEQAYEQYGERIALLGGIDVDFVCRSEPDAITARCKAMIEKSHCKGYALGTGNSVPDYVPDEKYFAMTKAALG